MRIGERQNVKTLFMSCHWPWNGATATIVTESAPAQERGQASSTACHRFSQCPSPLSPLCLAASSCYNFHFLSITIFPLVPLIPATVEYRLTPSIQTIHLNDCVSYFSFFIRLLQTSCHKLEWESDTIIAARPPIIIFQILWAKKSNIIQLGKFSHLQSLSQLSYELAAPWDMTGRRLLSHELAAV